MKKIHHAAQRLREERIPFKTIRDGNQFIVEPDGRKISFWPANGKFWPKNNTHSDTSHLNGVEDLINYLQGVSL